MKLLLKLSHFFLILFLISSCKTFSKKDPVINELENQNGDFKIKEKNKMELRVSCGDGNVKEFLDEGWKIVEESTQEKVCTWKSYPANKKCNMEKDKGCKITKPDKIGEEKIYLLEK